MKIFDKIAKGLAISAAAFSVGCSPLDLEPLDKIDGTAMFSDPKGVELYMANLYSKLPIEDFNYMRYSFNSWYGWNMVPAMFTDEATHSEYVDKLSMSYFLWFEDAFVLIRDVNSLAETLPSLTSITEEERARIVGEVAFIRAYAYYGLVIRYGGVPIIENVQQWNGNVDELKVVRNTEKEVWDYILKQCDIAAENLPEAWADGSRRATKWVALTLKTRAGLHAASIAKFGHKISLSGEAVTKGLVGLESSLAEDYYRQVIKAGAEIIDNGPFSLHCPEPASPEEAAENYRLIFEDPLNAPEECIFVKGYTNMDYGHNYNIYYGPAQLANGWPHPGRMNPNLELADAYEYYSAPGQDGVILTSDDPDDAIDYGGYDPAKNYYHYDKPYGIFEGKDARMWGTFILPGTTWKKTEIVIQAGTILPDGTPQILSGNPYTKDGVKYYVFGAQNKTDYSGFDTSGGNYTRTGFSFKKFLDERIETLSGYNKSLTDYIDMRYAEVLLNYAEAVAESGLSEDGCVEKATTALNATRRRAGHTTDVALTPENVQRERKVELAFENKRFWDLYRRREMHELHNNSMMHALLPVLDLRETPPSYIFVRSEIARVVRYTFLDYYYYHAIPGISSNGMIQNPNY